MGILILCLGGYASAHQWTPTYPKSSLSHVAGVLKVDMELFNSRADVDWYEISVYDKDWVPVKFVMDGDKIFNVPHLKKQNVKIYFRSKDIRNVDYICSKSKVLSNDKRVTVVSSRICSKLKK